ncbi:MAG: hypothetical protein A3F84_20850 [Candidatus Handelsmanbacteria bacterium RIFCSPLOWO2_12_FULL_64_10]|uniref:Uncharacterized protein n=1 Tax=Handelsmanbacteria sp. (strain RIFCSPLOWO2_12_FULL_64_10) TaxID=1817868 RepID=A0A1F6D4N5_HANXR|nr:MAG: hypothetical protein A3F84_20850 [Candidatus Handelsmanbacteria bacterium RIFCSPLOWO2_12_FULL_64_10]
MGIVALVAVATAAWAFPGEMRRQDGAASSTPSASRPGGCGCTDMVRAVILLENTAQGDQISLAAEHPFALSIPLSVTDDAGNVRDVKFDVAKGDARWRQYDDETSGVYHLDGLDASTAGGAGTYDYDRKALGAGDPCFCSYVKAGVTFRPLPHDPEMGASQTLLAMYEATIEILRYGAVIEIKFSGPGVNKTVGPYLEKVGRKVIFQLVSPKAAEGASDVKVDSILSVGPDLVTHYGHESRTQESPANGESTDSTQRPVTRPHDRAISLAFRPPPIRPYGGEPTAVGRTKPCDKLPYTIDGSAGSTADGEAITAGGAGAQTTDRPWISTDGTPIGTDPTAAAVDEGGTPAGGQDGNRGDTTTGTNDTTGGAESGSGTGTRTRPRELAITPAFRLPPIRPYGGEAPTTARTKPCDELPYTIGGTGGPDPDNGPGNGDGPVDRPTSPTASSDGSVNDPTAEEGLPTDGGTPTSTDDPIGGSGDPVGSESPRAGSAQRPFPQPPIRGLQNGPLGLKRRGPCD